MQSVESNVSNYKVDSVFNSKRVKLLKKRVGIGLAGAHFLQYWSNFVLLSCESALFLPPKYKSTFNL